MRVSATHYNGLLDGSWTEWHTDGQKFLSGLCRKDRAEGIWTFWHANDQKAAEGKREDLVDSPHRLSTQLSPLPEFGNYETPGHYSNAASTNQNPVERAEDCSGKTGPWTFWDENGEKTAEGNFENNLKKGHWKRWDKNGMREILD